MRLSNAVTVRTTTIPWHTVCVTGREQLAARARAAGLRLSPADLDRLAKPWQRYSALVNALQEALRKTADPLDNSQ